MRTVPKVTKFSRSKRIVDRRNPSTLPYKLSSKRMEEEVDIMQSVLQSTLEEVNKTADNVIEDHDDPCVICLEAVHERAVASPCRHFSFDFLCLVSWLQQRSTCPLCM